MSRQPLARCAVLVDVENISTSVLAGLMRWLRSQFDVTMAIGFADFEQPALTGLGPTLRQLGITPRHVRALRVGPCRYKSLADPALIVEMLMIYARDPNDIDVYVLVSGDGHFLPVVQALRAVGKHVIVAAMSHSSNAWLRREADEFIPLNPARTWPRSASKMRRVQCSPCSSQVWSI